MYSLGSKWKDMSVEVRVVIGLAVVGRLGFTICQNLAINCHVFTNPDPDLFLKAP